MNICLKKFIMMTTITQMTMTVKMNGDVKTRALYWTLAASSHWVGIILSPISRPAAALCLFFMPHKIILIGRKVLGVEKGSWSLQSYENAILKDAKIRGIVTEFLAFRNMSFIKWHFWWNEMTMITCSLQSISFCAILRRSSL